MVPRKPRPSLWGFLASPDAHKTITAIVAGLTLFVGVSGHRESSQNERSTASVYVQITELNMRIDSLLAIVKKHERQDRARFRGKAVAYGPEIAPEWYEQKKPNVVRKLLGWLNPFKGG